MVHWISVPDYVFVPLAESRHSNIRTFGAESPEGLLVSVNGGPPTLVGGAKLPNYSLDVDPSSRFPSLPFLYVDHRRVYGGFPYYSVRLLALTLRDYTTKDFAFYANNDLLVATADGIVTIDEYTKVPQTQAWEKVNRG